MGKALKRVVAAVALTAVPLMGAPAAMAVDVTIKAGPTECPRNGNPGGGQRCTVLDNGVLTVRNGGDRSFYTVNYYRTGGGSLTARNGVERSGNNTWAAFRNMSSTPFHYENSFSLGVNCAPVRGLIQPSGGSSSPTPPVPADC